MSFEYYFDSMEMRAEKAKKEAGSNPSSPVEVEDAVDGEKTRRKFVHKSHTVIDAGFIISPSFRSLRFSGVSDLDARKVSRRVDRLLPFRGIPSALGHNRCKAGFGAAELFFRTLAVSCFLSSFLLPQFYS